jgi:D-alanyl-D-alanine carboxypeptidase
MKKRLIAALLLFVLVLFAIVAIRKEAEAPSSKKSGQSSSAKQAGSAGFNKNRYSIDSPSSLWVIVNKNRPLPGGYVPSRLIAAGNGELLSRDAAQDLSKLIRAAAIDGVYLRAISGYRSYDAQTSIYNSFVAQDGSKADNYSARPGHSEHQTGLGVDLGNSDGSCDLDVCFANTAGGRWLARNAHKFGFIIRYLEGKQAITGYQAEPWHLRYAGKELAAELQKSGQTMEEFFMLPPAPSY